MVEHTCRTADRSPGRVALAVVATVSVGGPGVAILTGVDPVAAAPALFGLVGLAVEDDPIARLAEKVEQLESGAEDVDLSTDRTDEVGRLYEAVAGMADRLRERERESRADERYRRELHRITTDADATGDEKIRRLLELGRRRLDVETGMVSRIDGRTYEVVMAAGNDSPVPESPTDLSEMYCEATVETEDVLGIHDAPATGWADHPSYRTYGVGCYLGTKLLVDDELYGTLCFLDRDPRDEPFTHAEKAFVDLMGRWVSHLYERRERERELRLKERAMDAAPVGVTITDPSRADNPVVYANETFEELTGYDAEEIVGRNCRFLQGEETDPETVEAMREAIDDQRPVSVELRNYRKDGTQFWNRVSIAPIRADDGGVTNYVGFQEDVTERVENARRLRERERDLERYRAYTDDVLDAVEDVFYVLDREGNPQRWNESLRAVTGYSDEEIESMHALEFFAEDDHDVIANAIEEVFETGDARVEVPFLTADGASIPHEFVAVALEDPDGNPVLAGIGRDVSERKARERELERTRNLLQQAGHIARVGGWELDLTADPPEFEWTDELYRLHGLPPDADVDMGTLLDLYHPDDRAFLREQFEAAIEAAESYDMEVRALTTGGDDLWVRALCEPVVEDGEVVKLRGSVQDVTEHKEREFALESLHDATRDLLGTDGEDEVARLVVDTAAAVFDVPGIAVYLLDAAANELEPAAYTPAFEDLAGGPPTVAVGDGDSALWNCFVTSTPTVVDGDDLFGTAVETGLVVPVGDHGVFVVAAPSGGIDDWTRRLVETLAATAAAAFDRLASEATLRERDAELEARNRRLSRQIQITDIIRGIDQSLIGASSREEIESVVCERLADADDVAFAWIGSFDAAGTELQPRAWDGEGQEYLDAVSLASEAPEPAVAAARTGTPTVVGNVVEGLKEEAWRKSALAADFQSAVAVPLSFDEYSYGVLAVYADEAEAFGDLEREVFEELGESIANSINAVQTRAALHGGAFLELTLELDGSEAFLARVAREADAEVEYEGLATQGAPETRLFFATTGTDPGDVRTVLADLVSVEDFRLVSETEGRALFEATVTGDVIASRLVRHGASPRSIRATAGGLAVVVDVPTTTDVREFVEMLRDRYPSVELVGRRDVQRAAHASRDVVASLFEKLTDRQQEVLRTAYFAGFFEWPRESTGEEVAAMLGISQPTVNRHLRHGQKRLLEELFESEPT